jgi:AraC-like DNA-binding protein
VRRYRLHENVERFGSGERLGCARVALELGYFDQSHLINDFKSIVGADGIAGWGSRRNGRG